MSGFRVYNGHQLQEVPYLTNHAKQRWGPGPKAWKCKGCGMEKKERTAFNKSECKNPTLWVQVGCPGDGLRVCRECDTVYIGDYSRGPFYERTCVECDSIDVYRDDDPDVDPGSVCESFDGSFEVDLVEGQGV